MTDHKPCDPSLEGSRKQLSRALMQALQTRALPKKMRSTLTLTLTMAMPMTRLQRANGSRQTTVATSVFHQVGRLRSAG